MTRAIVLVLAAVVSGSAVLALTPLGRDLLFHVIPTDWTDEPARLGEALGLARGATVAEIGAGNGHLITALAAMTGPEGTAFASERTPGQRDAIFRRAQSRGVSVRVLEAPDHTTNLGDACCDAIVMRMVLHHLADPGRYAVDLRRAIKRGGRLAIIDFAPGALPHLADDHGVSPDAVSGIVTAAGFTLLRRDDEWGGRTFLLVFAAR
jgi:SAM-dependent methyltransferase